MGNIKNIRRKKIWKKIQYCNSIFLRFARSLLSCCYVLCSFCFFVPFLVFLTCFFIFIFAPPSTYCSTCAACVILHSSLLIILFDNRVWEILFCILFCHFFCQQFIFLFCINIFTPRRCERMQVEMERFSI